MVVLAIAPPYLSGSLGFSRMAGFDGISIDYEEIRNTIRTRTRRRGCPACNERGGWDGPNEILKLDVAHEEANNGVPPKPEKQRKIWLVQIRCPQCGYTESYNLFVLLGQDPAD
jgi:hypothetical protein